MSNEKSEFQRYAKDYDPVKIGSIDETQTVRDNSVQFKPIFKQLFVRFLTRDQRAGSYLAQQISIAIQHGNAASLLGMLLIDGTDTKPHDRAIVRALYSEYTPNKSVKGDPRHTVFVGRLHPKTTQDTLTSEFSDCGKIIRCRLVRDIVTGKSRQYAFMEFEHSSGVERALNKHREYVDNVEVVVEREAERVMKGWKPRRLGGGFGGNKASGQLRFGCRERPFKRPIKISAFGDHGERGRESN